MEKNHFFSVYGLFLFILCCLGACTNVENSSPKEANLVFFASDILDAKIAEIENDSIFTVRGEEFIEDTDSIIIRHCPVKFINEKNGTVIDTVFIFEEKY